MAEDGHNSSRRRSAWMWRAPLAVLIVGAAAVAAGAWRLDGWAHTAVVSRGFLTHAGVVVVGGAVLTILLAVLARAGAAIRRGRRRLAMGAAGTVILEFAMVLPILMFMLLIMVQSALLMVGHLSVNYAAFCAARSAAVVIPADWTNNSGEGPNDIGGYIDSSAKLLMIRDAAAWAIMPVAGSERDLVGEPGAVNLTEGMHALFGAYNKNSPAWVDRLLARKLQYARDYTTVTVLPPMDGAEYGHNETLEVTVEHTFYLSIPYAARLYALFDRTDGVEMGERHYGMVITASCPMTNEGITDTISPDVLSWETDYDED
ncbi:MAG: TadE family protein [Planctomycetota bacterium]|jgi:hypothetical protein